MKNKATDEELQNLIDYLPLDKYKINLDDTMLNRLGSYSGLMAYANPYMGEELTLGDLATSRLYGRRIANLANKLINN